MAIAAGTPDYGDAKLLSAATENIFIAKVTRKLSSRPIRHGLLLPFQGEPQPHFIPGVQYAVEVEENVKGYLLGMIVFSQEGEEGGWIEDHASLLEVGQTYLLATRYDADEGWHAVARQPWGVIRIENERHRVTLVEGFERALRGGSFRPYYLDLG